MVELTVGGVVGYAIWDAVKDWSPRWPAPRQDPVVAIDRVGVPPTLRSPDPVPQVPQMESARYHLRGRPDELRRAPDGRLVPVEIKSAPAPRGGPLPSHRAQLLAYCLLVEEHLGRPPPYGVLCYGDGTEFRVTWDARARAEVLAGLARLGKLYMGEADRSIGKCRACRFRDICPIATAFPGSPAVSPSSVDGRYSSDG